MCPTGNVVDTTEVTFGIRSVHFDPATGFYLNGVSMKIKGTANHQDAAAVGVAVPDHLQAWRVSALKEMVCAPPCETMCACVCGCAGDRGN